MKKEENAGFIEALTQLDDYYSPQVEALQDQIMLLKRENRELRMLKDRSVWRVIKDKMIERLSK
jgi:prefoldin subunit 5|tara:strand:- start:1253 stop:1444 length:192 start_codon:yes stop_codon:yes gene_type:complete